MGTKVVTPRMYTYVRPMETTRHLDGWVFAAVIGQVSGLQREWNHKAHMPTCPRWLQSHGHQSCDPPYVHLCPSYANNTPPGRMGICSSDWPSFRFAV